MEELKQKITGKAKELFLKYGLRSVTIDDICRELHISKKTFYTVIKGKEELIEAVLEEMRAQSAKKCTKCDDVIVSLVETVMSAKRDSMTEKHINIFFDLDKYYPSIMERHKELAKKAGIKNTAEKIRLGIEQGYFREDMNVEAMSIVFDTLNISNLYNVLKKELGMTTTQIMDMFIDISIRMVANEKGLLHYQELKEQATNQGKQ